MRSVSDAPYFHTNGSHASIWPTFGYPAPRRPAGSAAEKAASKIALCGVHTRAATETTARNPCGSADPAFPLPHRAANFAAAKAASKAALAGVRAGFERAGAAKLHFEAMRRRAGGGRCAAVAGAALQRVTDQRQTVFKVRRLSNLHFSNIAAHASPRSPTPRCSGCPTSGRPSSRCAACNRAWTLAGNSVGLAILGSLLGVSMADMLLSPRASRAVCGSCQSCRLRQRCGKPAAPHVCRKPLEHLLQAHYQYLLFLRNTFERGAAIVAANPGGGAARELAEAMCRESRVLRRVLDLEVSAAHSCWVFGSIGFLSFLVVSGSGSLENDGFSYVLAGLLDVECWMQHPARSVVCSTQPAAASFRSQLQLCAEYSWGKLSACSL